MSWQHPTFRCPTWCEDHAEEGTDTGIEILHRRHIASTDHLEVAITRLDTADQCATTYTPGPAEIMLSFSSIDPDNPTPDEIEAIANEIHHDLHQAAAEIRRRLP